jgi:hypothetical protein
MLNKFLITTFFLIIFSNCGYTPIYYQKDTNFKIDEISFEGDNVINNFLNISLKRYSKKDQDIKYTISAKTKYEKNIYSKNQAGDATKFELLAETKFKIFKTNIFIKDLLFKEKFIMQSFDDQFEEGEYERSIKHNFSQSISNKLITELSSIK